MDVEWLIIADAAQVVGGKLYLLGGGYDRVTLPKQPPAPHNMAVAVAFRVSWIETNVKHDFELEVLDGDGNQIVRGSGQFEVGRPLGIPPGQDQRAQMAMNLGWNVQEARLVRGRGPRQRRGTPVPLPRRRQRDGRDRLDGRHQPSSTDDADPAAVVECRLP